MELIIYEDCMTLIQNFVKCGQLQFEVFCSKWRELKFEHIWSAQTSCAELIQTTVAALHVGKRLACGRLTSGQPIELSHAHLENAYRISGIYLMYAIYFKQPEKSFTKIEVSLQTWNLIRIFIDVLQENPSSDTLEVRFIFWKLVEAKAFRFTAHDFDLGVEGLVDYDSPPAKLAFASKNKKTNLENTLHCVADTEKMLPATELLERRYNEMKKELSCTKGGNAQSLPAGTTIINELRKTLDKITEILKTEPKDKEDNNSVETKRRSIKRKAYKIDTSPKNQNTQISKATDENHPNEEATNSFPSGINSNIERRQSSRTVFKNTLPKSINKEVEDDDIISEGDEGDPAFSSMMDSLLQEE